ncbi:MAG: alpha/beta hydrolase [Thermodesulfobacteriota bacterium]
MTEISSATFTIADHSIHTLTAGTPGNRAVVFLHGKAFQAETWRELGTIELLAENGFFVLALDLPGFGQSPAAELTADQVISEALKKHRISDPILVGPSMGGQIALEFSLAHPATLSGLVLIGAVGVETNRDRLPDLGVKTLIVWGENDHISAPENGRTLSQLIPDNRLVVIQGAKHACYLEQPDTWHKELLNFIKSFSN